MPQPGRVKTRLARRLGAGPAARLYRAFTEDLVERLCGGPWKLAVAMDPAWPPATYRRWLRRVRAFWRQGSGNLGARLAHVTRRALARGWDPVVAVGSDMPHLSGQHVLETIEVLDSGRADLVLGPARDGGYYLVGLRRPHDVFTDIPWSTDQVLQATLARARGLGLRVHLLPQETDVDTAEDWHHLRRALLDGAVDAAGLPRTARLARLPCRELLPPRWS